ncbi:unnamed protein product [Parnassius apollo]|uniref:(apollo) hypothetical protein n=1 Tax=Parnassius apollo TaxID=110799 RepID=A0A8S3XJV0_PARAO|nr:unnamed protein product [Parnassius apollo]
MSLIKLFKAPSKIFKKDVITFLMIRRHDLGILEERLRYVAVRPNASIMKLREKIWYLLDLPDYCDEIIVLKSNDANEIPLTALCYGNDPQHPYILEVWLPENQILSSSVINNNNMLTMGYNESVSDSNHISARNIREDKTQGDAGKTCDFNKSGVVENNQLKNVLHTENKKQDLAHRISNTSVFFKMPERKGVENFTCILLKMQSDLSTLSNKLSQLENKINF